MPGLEYIILFGINALFAYPVASWARKKGYPQFFVPTLIAVLLMSPVVPCLVLQFLPNRGAPRRRPRRMRHPEAIRMPEPRRPEAPSQPTT